MADNWLIDLGHTRIKWARASGSELSDFGNAAVDDHAILEQMASSSAAVLWLSAQSRHSVNESFGHQARTLGLTVHAVATGSRNLPVAPAYDSLGSDRWLALQWPWLQDRSALCVIDCGTALTVDVIDGNGQHRGGWIMAGLDTARSGLLARADRLPRKPVDAAQPDQPATASDQAIAAGTLLQAAGGIDRALAAARAVTGNNPQVWITGGDAAAIMPLLNPGTRHDQHLVLRGLALAAREDPEND